MSIDNQNSIAHLLKSNDSHAEKQIAIMRDIQEENAFNQRMQVMQAKEWHREHLAETRASRYATEALKDTDDRLEWYERQKWFESL